MEIFAEYFDAPPTSREHLQLRDEAWLGGVLITVRYYLGRLLNRNLFRESNDEVQRTLNSYLESTTSRVGAELIAGEEASAWSIVVPVLKYRFETDVEGALKRKPREVAAIEAFLTDPAISSEDLARESQTTEKQLLRMTELSFARALPHRLRHRQELNTRPGPTRRKSRQSPEI